MGERWMAILPVEGTLADQVSEPPGCECLRPLQTEPTAAAGGPLSRPGVGPPGVQTLTVPQHSHTAAGPEV